MAAMSLRLTARARHPTSGGAHSSRVKWIPSTWMSQVTRTRPARVTTAASSPIPATTPGPRTGTRRATRWMRASSPRAPRPVSPGSQGPRAGGSGGERRIHGLPEPPRGLHHVLGQAHRGDHGHAGRAGADHRGGGVGGDAPDPHHGDGDGRADGADPLEADGLARVGLGTCGVHRSDAHVVRAVPPGRQGLLHRRGRDAEEPVRAQQGARGGRRQVVLADVGAVRPGRHRHVHAVVDEQGDAPQAAQGQEQAGHLHQDAGGLLLHAELDRRRPAPEGGLGDVPVGPAPLGPGLGDHADTPASPGQHRSTRARALTVAASSPASAARSIPRKVPGPSARDAAISAATPTQTSAPATAPTPPPTARKAATAAVAMHPLPGMWARRGWPLWTRTRAEPSVTTSTGPVAATRLPVARATSTAHRAASAGSPTASTPRTKPGWPPREAISPAFPRMQATRTSPRIRRASRDRNALAPTPTGSRTTGTPARLAARPARHMASTTCGVRVPMFRASAPALAATSSTSSGARAMTGLPPRASVAAATS